MLTGVQRDQFIEKNYTVAPDVLTDDVLSEVRDACVSLSEREPGRISWKGRSCLRHSAFRHLPQASTIIEIKCDPTGDDVQLLKFDLLRTHTGEFDPEWRRDVDFTSYPVARACHGSLSRSVGWATETSTAAARALGVLLKVGLLKSANERHVQVPRLSRAVPLAQDRLLYRGRGWVDEVRQPLPRGRSTLVSTSVP
jgi:hypothetical protein